MGIAEIRLDALFTFLDGCQASSVIPGRRVNLCINGSFLDNQTTDSEGTATVGIAPYAGCTLFLAMACLCHQRATSHH